MFAFDLVRTVEPLDDPNPDPVGLPDLALMLTDTLVVFDHLRRTITVVAHPADDEQTARGKIADVKAALAAPLPPGGSWSAGRRWCRRRTERGWAGCNSSRI